MCASATTAEIFRREVLGKTIYMQTMELLHSVFNETFKAKVRLIICHRFLENYSCIQWNIRSLFPEDWAFWNYHTYSVFLFLCTLRVKIKINYNISTMVFNWRLKRHPYNCVSSTIGPKSRPLGQGAGNKWLKAATLHPSNLSRFHWFSKHPIVSILLAISWKTISILYPWRRPCIPIWMEIGKIS